MNNRASLQLGGDNWAAKDANLLAYKTSLSEKNFLPIEFDFERGANLAATRVDENGLIEKGRKNFLLQSNQFDTTWTTVNASVSSGQSGYDGTSDAWLLSKSAANGFIYQSISSSPSGIQSISVYAKKGTNNWLQIYVVGAVNARTYFDLENGVLGGYQLNVINRSIENIGNGWYRCRMSFNSSNTSIARIFPSDGNNDDTGTNGSIYIQDSQFEQGLAATDYIETGATTAQAGVLEDLPRINYSGSTPSLLLEPSRTNLLNFSEYFDGSGWTIQPNTTTAELTNETLSPEGKYNAYKFAGNGTSGFFYPGVGTSGINTKSIYLKAIVAGTQVVLKDPNQTITQKTLTLTTEWQRYDLTETQTGQFGIWIDDIPSDAIYAWGAQVEAGSYATSYIPTYGTAATRGADTSTVTGVSSLIGQTEGTFYVDFEYLDGQSGNNENWFALESDAGGDRILFYKGGTTNQRVLIQANSTTVYTNTSMFALSAGTRYKLAVRYNSGDIAVYANGSQISTNATTYTRTDNLNNVTFNESNQQLSSRFNQMLVFPEGLSNDDLATLTTL